MKQPTGQLAFAYNTINKLEVELNKQREINLELVKALESFVKSCYVGCSKVELDQLRQNAEEVLKSITEKGLALDINTVNG